MTNQVLERLQQGNFKDLAGTNLHVKVPLTRAFINWNAQQSLPDKIESVKVKSIQGRIIVLQVETTIPLVPVFDITLELYENLSLPQLKLKLKIIAGLGWIARSVVDTLLPDGMDIEGKVLTINLFHFIFKNKKYRTIAHKITSARWIGGQDKLILEFELQL
ncbi:MAG: hypothetical protein LH618_05995 [Saprospiraceae bacterium]|nr:hypothetical protein [Saprospiraceae bacterium]